MTTGLNRRQALALTAGGLAVCAAPGLLAQEGPSLHELARTKGMRFGTAVGMGRPGTLTGAFSDPAYRAIVQRECGILVHENALKWYVLRPDEETYFFTPADTLVDFATENGLAVRGHTLLWNREEFSPAWVNNYDFGSRPASEAERLVREHIATVVAHYRGRITSWDVINETIDPRTGRLRETSLTRHLGENIVDIAFDATREADPGGELVYNDYMSWEAGHEMHQEGVLRLLEGMRERGVPIDALGVQSHIGSGNFDESTGFDTARDEHWRGFLDGVTGLDLDLLITEFDVHDKNLPYDIESRDTAVADLARRYLDLMFSYPQTKDVLCWGLCDRYSWLQNLWPRSDGEAKRPTPFDADYRPKPLYDAIAAAFQAAAPR
ncbi:endo-1,4-beta-xylanase [Maricaulis sp.]|uniref:endo-1,4-beta-xylanase n=1 Tax=Maricaulis sp. TaxID=1486257 RepID=UPI00261494BE|nr:endo-1,4-beta-xylanase [Maricaulis sp.]